MAWTKEQRAAYMAGWRAANKDRKASQDREWKQRNRDRARSYPSRSAWDAAHRGDRARYDRRWRNSHPDAVINKSHRRRALLRAVSVYEVTEWDLARLWNRQEAVCAHAWCDRPAEELDHIIPLARGGEHRLGNLQYLSLIHI